MTAELLLADLLLGLARCNIAAGVACVAVLALREPLCRWFGAQHAYAAWLIVPLAAAGSLMPAKVVSGAAGPIQTTNDQVLGWLAADGRTGALTALWLIGAFAAIAVAAWRQARFDAAVRAGRAGPAAVGVIQPRLVVPADFNARFSDEERRLVRAHELAHIDRLDARYNTAAALATWVCWFNPLLHLAVRAMRQDQELACDATVLEQMPGVRRLYAETLLRTHRATVPPLLGCQWDSPAAHPLVARVRMLVRTPPSHARRDIGLAILLACGATAFTAAWAMQPPVRPSAEHRPAVVLVDLAPPDATASLQGAAVYRIVEASTAKSGER
jgi:beta-lactamase regulating signal transducer with metallopeptidase domain